MSEPTQKCCARCEVPFARHPKDSEKQWASRLYCSKACANIANGRKARIPLIERFRKYVDRREDDACWPWTGSTDQHGYGRISQGRGLSPKKAHRIAYELFKGPILDGLHVCHACDNPNCVNPNHLWVGTAKDNALDRVRKGRSGPRRALGDRAPGAKLRSNQIALIKLAYNWGAPQPAIAAACGVSQATISKVILGKSWKEASK